VVEPIVIPRAQHTISRRDIDPDALRVLYRLHQAGHRAYLVGGSVRDLLLGRRPKDFDVGTDAHPYQIKKLFRNCWIIGRRFRLAHVKFGTKVIEVATFRRGLVPGTESEPPLASSEDGAPATEAVRPPEARSPRHTPIHHDDTFGTPEEDAFRRDFTINALFCDVSSFAILDYVGGLADLQNGVIRCIGDPGVRFVEDPVRMLRAMVFRARLDFDVDQAVWDAIGRHRAEIARSAPARLLEEYFKILRSGAALRTFHELGDVGLLGHISPEITFPLGERLRRSLEALDRYRARFATAPDSLTTPILLGSLLVPLGLPQRRPRRRDEAGIVVRDAAVALGLLPVPRRDIERLAQIVALERRLHDLDATPRSQAALTERHSFGDALTWLEIHGDAPETVAHWHELVGNGLPSPDAVTGERAPRPRRRRRRRRPAPVR
jgi:poly(A) polymerase